MEKGKIMRFVLLFLLLLGVFSQRVALLEATGAKPVVKADKSYFDPESGLYVLKGNVQIEIRNQKITAGQAKASLSTLEIWGAGGVGFIQDDMSLTADSVHVISAQNRALIDGNVSFSRGELIISANNVELDWANKTARFEGDVKLTNAGISQQTDCLVYSIENNTWQ